MDKSKKDWIPYLDFARVLAIVLIVLFHASQFTVKSWDTSNIYTVQIIIGLRTIANVALPFLFMISGFIMLNPNKKITLKQLYSKYVLRFILGIVIFGLLYECINLTFKHSTVSDFSSAVSAFSLDTVCKALIDIVTGNIYNNAYHIWFLYAIMWLYILLPLLKIYTEKANLKIQIYVLILICIFTFVVPTVQELFDINFKFDFPIQGQYLVYFMSGYYISCLIEKKKITKNIVYILILIYVVTFIGLFFMDDSHPYPSKSLKNLLTYVNSFSVLICVTRLKGQFKISRWLNKNLYGVYLIHLLFMSPRFFNINLVVFDPLFVTIILAIFSFSVSLLIVWLLRKISFIRQYIL